MSVRRTPWRASRTLGLAGVLLLTAGAGAAAVADPGLPGPPPGAASGLPLPPVPGASPTPTADAPTVAITGSSSTPGLRSGFATVTNGRLGLTVTCTRTATATLRDGSVKVKAPATCRHRQAAVRFALTPAQARTVTGGGGSIATLALAGARLSVAVSATAPVPSFWTSTFGLDCTAGGPTTALLSAPNFTVTPTTTVDVRPWLAWYTPATGWQWLGLRGPGRSSWLPLTATPTGVFEWQSGGVTTPWTWGPIQVAGGHATRLIAVFEAVYWYSHPVYVWRYAHGQPGSTSAACGYA